MNKTPRAHSIEPSKKSFAPLDGTIEFEFDTSLLQEHPY
jgi:hypothetical protein